MDGASAKKKEKEIITVGTRNDCTALSLSLSSVFVFFFLHLLSARKGKITRPLPRLRQRSGGKLSKIEDAKSNAEVGNVAGLQKSKTKYN